MVHSDGSVKAEKDELPGKYVKLMDGSYVELSDDNIKDVLFTDVEISSRILPMENNSMEEIDRVIGVVREKVAAFAPRSAGLHVHVGNRAVGFNARTAKNFLTLMCIC